ncbi:uncharacterized protein RJT20DRAFT_141644 [Scheffersomyces xylosifermentans]|uniref:uncharacterized protein n=1 Tax=Scheffersomyces xylosifermentans TaxID=1304137 RepID=UPI00315DB47A
MTSSIHNLQQFESENSLYLNIAIISIILFLVMLVVVRLLAWFSSSACESVLITSTEQSEKAIISNKLDLEAQKGKSPDGFAENIAVVSEEGPLLNSDDTLFRKQYLMNYTFEVSPAIFYKGNSTDAARFPRRRSSLSSSKLPIVPESGEEEVQYRSLFA